MIPVWMTSISAMRLEPPYIGHAPLITTAPSATGCRVFAMQTALDRWPRAESWRLHDVATPRLVSDVLNDLEATVHANR